MCVSVQCVLNRTMNWLFVVAAKVMFVLVFAFVSFTDFVEAKELSYIAQPKQSDRNKSLPDIGLVADTLSKQLRGEFKPGSHVRLFLPNLPYIAVSHAVNAGLMKPAENDKGLEYDLALSHLSIDDKIWEFKLRKGVKFQDGTPFNADAVLENMAYFKKKPYTFTRLHQVYQRTEKIDDYTVRFYLSEPYGMFLNDAIWLHFYTKKYLQKFGWNGKPVCPNLAAPGPYGLGPYILTEGYVEGDRSTPEVILKANPQYWGSIKPKIETITIITRLELARARDMNFYDEGKVDITPVPFADEAATVLAPYSKLTVSASTNNYAVHFNMLNGHPAIKDDRIRFVINHAIKKEDLLNQAMLGEGGMTPALISPNFYRAKEAILSLRPYFKTYFETHKTDKASLRKLVQEYQREQGLDPTKPLELSFLCQESFLFLTREIQFFLAEVNIDLRIDKTESEKDVFKQLFSTWANKNDRQWDMLIWGNFDWHKHPWATFFVLKPFNAWSTIPKNKKLDELTDRLARISPDSNEYVPMIADFIRTAFEGNYMLFLPTPNNVYAVNKEVYFNPGRSAFVYLNELEVSDFHWSLRKNKSYPVERQKPIAILRRNF